MSQRGIKQVSDTVFMWNAVKALKPPIRRFPWQLVELTTERWLVWICKLLWCATAGSV